MMSTNNNNNLFSKCKFTDNGPESISVEEFSKRVFSIAFLSCFIVLWLTCSHYVNHSLLIKGDVSEAAFAFITIFYSFVAMMMIYILAILISFQTGRLVDVFIVTLIFTLLFYFSNHLLIAIFMVKFPKDLSNAYMHAVNGNISNESIRTILTFLRSEVNLQNFASVLTVLLDHDLSHYERARFPLQIHDTFESFGVDEGIYSLIVSWENLIKSSVDDFLKWDSDEKYRSTWNLNPDTWSIGNRLRSAWIDFTLTNAGVHALNGNGKPSTSPKKRNVYGSPNRVPAKPFQDWFRLNADSTNLCTLVNAWCKRLERHFKTLREDSGECTDFKILSRLLTEFSDFRSTLDPHTINRVEEYLLISKNPVEPQMGLFSVDLNVKHSVPLVENFGNSLYNSLPEEAKFLNGESLNLLNDACMEPLLWAVLSFIIYGIGNHYSSVPITYKRVVITMIPFAFMFSLVRETSGLIDSLLAFRSLLMNEMRAEETINGAGMSLQMETLAGESSKASPQMQTETLIDAAGILYGALSYKIFGLKTPESALKQISAFWHARPAIEDAILKLSGLVEQVANEIIIEHTSFKPLRFLSSRSAIFRQFESECDALILAFNKGELVPTVNLYHQVKSLEVKMKIEYSKMAKDKNLVGSARIFYSELQKIENIRVYIERKTGVSRSLRQEPVVVMFRGSPGTGKSLTTQYLAYDAAMMDCTPEEKEVLLREPKSFQYDRMPDPFWTGYQPDTKVCIKDDFDQVRDVVGVPNSEFMEFIRAGSSAAFPLNMAHLEEKGNVFFRAKFLICNTNSNSFDVQSIRREEAVNRRVNINLFVVPRIEFCTDSTKNSILQDRRMDYAKLPKDANGVSLLTPEAQDFFLVNSKGEVTFSDPLSYQDVLQLVKETYDKKTSWHDCQLKELVNRTGRAEFDRLAQTSFNQYLEEAQSSLLNDEEGKLESFITKASYAAFNNCHYDPTIALANLYEAYSEPYVSEVYEDYLFSGEVPEFPDTVIDLEPIEERSFSFSIVYAEMMSLARKAFSLGTTWFRRLIDFLFSDKCKMFLGAVTMLSGIYGLYSYFSSPVSAYEPQSFNIGDKGASKKKKEKFVGKDFKSLYPVVPQLGDSRDPSGGDLLRAIMRKNAFVMSFESAMDSGKFIKAGIVLAIKGRFVMMPYHFVTKFASMMADDDSYGLAKVRFQAYAASGYILEFRVCDLLSSFALRNKDPQIPDKDLCIFEMPADFQPRSDIVKNFALRKDNSQFQKNIPFKLISFNVNPESFGGYANAIDREIEVPCKWADTWYIREGYEYKASTVAGDCGSIFCVMNPGIQGRKIFGMHVAGEIHSEMGFAESICQEEIIEKLKELDCVNHNVEVSTSFAVPQLGSFLQVPQFNVIGKLDKPIPATSGTSDIKRSLLFDAVSPHTCMPAKLKPFSDSSGELVDPLWNAKLKFGVSVASLPHELVSKVVEYVFSHFEHVSKKNVQRRLFNEEEILYGIPGEDSVRGINTSTSPGYPDVLKPTAERLKFRIFSHEKDTPDNLAARAELQQFINVTDEQLANNIRPEFLNILTLKDEKREISKVNAGKTRGFMNGGFPSLVSNKRYFGAFASWMTLNRIDNGITGGVNVFSDEWHFLALKVLNGSEIPNVGAGDFSSFDGSHMTIFMWYVVQEINKWYDDQYSTQRSILVLDLMNPRIIDYDLLSEPAKTLPSGHYLTFLMNSILNQCYHVTCWVLNGQILETFYLNVYLATHGDDSLFMVNDAYASVFNEHELERLMPEIGLTYTSETKGTSEKPLRRLHEVCYLKRYFVFDDIERKFIAPMKLDAVLEPLNWSKSSDYLGITVSNVDSTLRELSLWGRDTFNLYQKKIVSACIRYIPEATFVRPIRSNFSFWRRVTLNSEHIV